MSLYGMMRTGVSGMNAQSTRLATVADNIANSGTNGYKRASVEFASLVIPNTGTSYVSGGVSTQIRYSMSAGNLQYTTSITDLAIDGNGFFVVQDASGQNFLTRAGSFIPDGKGNLVNAAGFYLMGRSFELGEPGTSTDFSDFRRVTIPASGLERVASTFGALASNLPFSAPVYNPPVPGQLPSDNPSTSTHIEQGMADGSIFKSSLTAIGNAGEPIRLDIYFTKTATNEWEMTVFHQPNASATTAFPYQGFVQDVDGLGDPLFDVNGDPVMIPGPAAPLATATLAFDPATGRLDGSSATSITLDLNNPIRELNLNGQPVEIDLSGMRELAASYTPLAADMNGSSPSAIDRVVIDGNGVVSAQYENGAIEKLFRLDLAYVQSPDQLTVLPGNVFTEGLESGKVAFGRPNEIALGSIVSGAIENSNVDIAEELTNMIESQRNYTANSKVFQTGSDLMDVLVNLKR